MTALTAYLKGRLHGSYRTLKEYFCDVVGIDISAGFLAKQIKKVSAALKSPYEELEEFLKEQEHLYGESYFLFVEDTAIAPTNNFAEQGIRTLVLDRIVTQGVRSDAGNEWHERFWTTVATCRRLGMNVMSFLREAIFAVAHGLSPPSLLPKTATK